MAGSGIRARTLLLSAVPLGFLLLLLALALFLQSRNVIVLDESHHLSQQIDTADRATELLDNASRSVLAYARSRNERDLQAYRTARAQLPASLMTLARMQPHDLRGLASEERLSHLLTAGLGVITAYLGDVRAGRTNAERALTISPSGRLLSAEVPQARVAFDEQQRSLMLDRRRAVIKQITVVGFALIGVCAAGGVVTVLLALRFSRQITQRITRLAENAQRLARGEAAEYVGGNDEIAELDLVYREMMARTKREHDTVMMLQRALLPERLPQVAGVRLDAAYVPAFGGAVVGGDWYDVFSISDRLLGISVGDVAGHGLRAATIMGQARQALRTASYIDDDPAAVLGHVNRLLCRAEPSVLVTASHATLDLFTGTLRYALAGHPPPMFVKTGSAVESLEGHGFVLGVEARTQFKTFEVKLAVGSAVVFFTDGLVEANHDYTRGTDGLRDAIEDEYRNASRNIAEAIVQRVFAQTTPRDDVAVLFLAVTALGAAAFPPKRMTWTLDASVERSARRVKRAVLWQLGEMSTDSSDLSAAELVVNELLGNVARHAPGPAEIVLEWSHESAVVHVLDHGQPFTPPEGSSHVEPLCENGRGLFLVKTVSPDLRVEWTGEGNCVSALLPVKIREPSGAVAEQSRSTNDRHVERVKRRLSAQVVSPVSSDRNAS